MSFVLYNIVAQTTVTGSIISDGEALIGATISLKDGDGVGTTSNIEGNYELTVNVPPPFTLIVSYTGYTEKEIIVERSGVYNVDLLNNRNDLDVIIVTGVVNPKSRLESALTVSTVNTKIIEQSAPRTAAEVFRNIPGVRAENSGGDGNANLSARGVPVSAGGSRYFQIQEDGLPLILFGDISFGNSDNWLRLDRTIKRIESIRGGSASTQTSNSPAGIINLISKTGEVEGGLISTDIGLDYNSFRTDFSYGSPIGNGVSFHIGGFLRTGETQRTTGYIGNKGGQIKANLTKRFGEKGYIRVHFKSLNDRSAMFLPTPALVTGTEDDPEWGSIDGFDLSNGTQHSKFLTQSYGVSSLDGTRNQGDVTNGNNPISNSIGLEFDYDLGNDWSFIGKGRISRNRGSWLGPFTAGLGTPEAMLASVDGATSTDLSNGFLRYANGDPLNLGNGLLQNIHMFDVNIDNMDNFVSDVKITKSIQLTEDNSLAITAGYFRSTQNTATSWQWNAYLTEVKGDGTSRLVDVYNIDAASGDTSLYSTNGQWAYGTPVWGNCCQRNYNVVHTFSSPYFGIDAEITESLNVDASVRIENVRAFGRIRENAGANVTALDVNGNGTIEGLEADVPVLSQNSGTVVDDDFSFVTYTAGLNYKINNRSAVFGRYSYGASTRAADRTGYNADGSLATERDDVTQAELGYKMKLGLAGYINATAFWSETLEDAGFDITRPGGRAGNEFRALGLEVEGSYEINEFLSIVGSGTFVDADITKDNTSGTEANTDNTPQRQASFVYNLSPRFAYGENDKYVLGLSILGTTKSFAGDDNTLVQPGFAYFNLFARVGLFKGLSVGVSVNNLFNTIGITEVNNPNAGSALNGNGTYAIARSIAGRTSNLVVTYQF